MSSQETFGNMGDFKARMDMLALTLSLKRNDKKFNIPQNRQLLLSTYIKMIESDQDNFFTEKEQKQKIITSLKHSLEFSRLETSESIQNRFEQLRNNDSTDFLLFSVSFFPGDYRQVNGHVCGVAVYKKDENFVVLKVDKLRYFDGEAVSYFEIPIKNSPELSHLLFLSKDSINLVPHYIFKELTKLSVHYGTTPIASIEMKKQTTGNCVVTEIEASLRTILFNCRQDIFALDKDIKVTPKWNLKHPDPTLEMRRRFHIATKGDDVKENKVLDHIFNYYLFRKGKHMENPASATHLTRLEWYQLIRELYAQDLYISTIFEVDGCIPSTYNKSLLKEKSKIGELLLGWEKQGIQMIDILALETAKSKITYKIQLYKELLIHISIPIAQEMTEYLITQLEEKKQAIEVELHKRLEIEIKKQNEKMIRTVNVGDEAQKDDTEKNSDTVTKETKNERTEEKRSSLKSIREDAVIHAQRLTTIKPNKMKQSEQVKVNVTEKTESVSWEEYKKKNIASCFAFLRSLNPFTKKAEYSYVKLGIPEQESAKKVKFSTLFQRFQTNKKKPEPTSHRISRQQPMNISR
ncbi:hypothetical protein [Candidatus Enterococcus mangumiae]|uniref:Uncharacterized protein n=1 Tax=Candidatus Enterococcus mangumiae TaxID=2230878 RepID=A0ABZ2SVS6_9ENTE|nr:hypothetical protein [Enterococcus sp. DIV1094]MBO0489158.1 hypothetical protein [Enterococcus sp. DIV1094]